MTITTRNQILRRVGALSILATSLLLGRGIATGRQGVVVPSTAPDPLVTLNHKFHEAYQQARIDKLAKTGPVILASLRGLTLIRGAKRVEVPFPPPIFHRLKEVAHVPLLVYVMLERTEGQPFDQTQRGEVEQVRDLVNASIARLDPDAFPAGSIDRQRTLLETSRDYLTDLLHDGKAPVEGLNRFAQRTGPLMLANADDAATVHLNALHAQIEAWRGEFTPEEWRTMHVIVMSSHMAREGEIAMQYFRRLLNEPGEGHRLIYAEGISEEPKALDLLGNHLLDGSASQAFFGDPMRLHRDILADGATKALRSMTIRP